MPGEIVSNYGPQFRSAEFVNVCKVNGITFVTSPPYHPATDSSVENAVKSFKNSMLKAFKDNDSKNVTLSTLIQ